MKKAMKQSTLLLLLNSASSILILGVILLLIVTFARNRQVDEVNFEHHELTENATRFMIASTYLTGEARGYAATGDKAHYDNYMAELNERKNRENALERMNALGITSDEAQVVNRMMEISNGLIPQEMAAMEVATKGDYLSAAKSLLTAPYNNDVTELGTLKTQFLDKITQRSRQEVDSMIVVTRLLEAVTVVCAICTIVLQIIAYRVVRKRVILPIAEVSSGMCSIAEGDLTTHIDLQPDTSEIGMLVNSIHTMQTELRRYVSDISEKLTRVAAKDLDVAVNLEYIGDFKPIQVALTKSVNELNAIFEAFSKTAKHVAIGSEQVANSAQNVSSGAISQAAAIRKILGSVEEFDQRINDTADQAKMAFTLAQQAGVELSQSNEQLQGMLIAMQEINDASGEIGKIIKTIEDIAFQTNILALNAAVEAARAGVAGKGFAVVADEVRNLATKSADASKTTSKMIENSLMTIQNGVKIAKLASETFVNVTENAGKAAVAMGNISEEAADQVKEVMEIRYEIDQINNIVQNNTMAAEQQASSSEEISSETNHFKDMVLQFKLRPQQAAAQSASRA